MKWQIIILFVLVFHSMQVSKGQEQFLYYKDFISKVEKNHPLSKKYENTVAASELKFQAARGNYDPFVNASYENKFYTSKNYYSVLHSEIKQPLFTSQYIKLGYDYGQGNFVSPEEKTPAAGIPYLGVEASILQGLLIDKRRAEVLKTKYYKDYAEADRKVLMNDLFYLSSIRYINWALAEKELELYTYFTELAKLRLDGIAALTLIEEKAPIDTVEAGLLYNSRIMDLQLVTMDYQKAKADVMSMYWGEDGMIPANADLLKPDSLEKFYEMARQLALQFNTVNSSNNPVLVKYKALDKVLKVDQRYKAELIKPKVDVKYNFLMPDNYTAENIVNTNSYKWGASVSFPFFLRNARNENKIAKLEIRNNNLEIDNKTNELNLKQQAVTSNISILLNQMLVAERSALYGRKMVEAERLKFDNGESTLFLINTRETKWLETEIKLARLRAKFIQMAFEYIYLEGSLKFVQ